MQVLINGKRWRLEFCPPSHMPKDSDGDPVHGICDHPATKGKKIRINSKLRKVEQIETIIHEILHASNWDLSEETVDLTAHTIAQILDKLGFLR